MIKKIELNCWYMIRASGDQDFVDVPAYAVKKLKKSGSYDCWYLKDNKWQRSSLLMRTHYLDLIPEDEAALMTLAILGKT